VAVLIEGLRASGDEVVEINEPLRLDTAARVAMVRQPWRVLVLLAKLGRCWSLLVGKARRYRRVAEEPDAVLVGYLGHFDVRLARRLFPKTPVVLDHLVSAARTAHDRGLAGSSGYKCGLLRAIDDGAIRRADVVVVDTHESRAALPPHALDKAAVVPVGATSEWFAQGRARFARSGNVDGPLRVVFVGIFTPLHGTGTLGTALAALAEDDRLTITMVGSGQDYEKCRAAAASNRRVTWIDWVPGGDLPALVGAHDVSLGIFGTSEKARTVVPTKVFQGAAAATAIVTSDTPPQRAALADAALFVSPGDVGSLVAAIRALAEDRALVAELQAAAYGRAVERFAPGTVVAAMRERVAGQPATTHP
jgi:glycosyltransferase involved in cell wall biosynthesis